MPDTTWEKLLDRLCGCTQISVTADHQDDDWKAELEYDRCTFQGRGDNPHAALLEATVDRDLANYFYAADFDATLTQERMTEWLHAAYQDVFGEAPEHEYRGDYVRKDK